MKPIPYTFLLSILLFLLFFGCSQSDEKVKKAAGKNEIPGLEDKGELKKDTLFNEENLSTDYSDIYVSIGEVYHKEGTYFVDVKVETKRENYHIDILGNLSDSNGNVKGSRVDSFYGPDSFVHTYGFTEIEGFRPHLLLLSIYNPIDGNWNDLKFIYF